MSVRLWWLVVGFLAACAGLVAALLPLLAVVALAVATAFVAGFLIVGVGSHASQWTPPVVFTGLAVLAVGWTGLRGPGDVTVSDFLFVAALGGVTLTAVAGVANLAIPGWLVGAGVVVLVSGLIADLFVANPPPRVNADELAAANITLPRASDLPSLLRLEFALVFVPVLIGVVASSPSRVRLLADLWVLSATCCAGLAIVDQVAGTGFGASIAGASEGSRQLGLSVHSNQLGLIAALAVPGALWRMGVSRGLMSWLATGCAGALSLGVLVSGSRAGLLALIVSVLLTLVFVAKLRPRLAATGMAAATGALVVVLFVPLESLGFSSLDRLEGDANAGIATDARFQRISESFEIALDHPVTGVGYAMIADAHSIPLQFWVSGGVLGFLGFVLFTSGVLGMGWKLARDSLLPEDLRSLSGACLASIGSWLLTGLINPLVADRFLYVPVGLLLAVWLIHRSQITRDAALPARGPALPPVRSGAALPPIRSDQPEPATP